MDIKQLTPFVSVSSQLSETDVGILAGQGYRTIINNRPDGEADDQPASTEIGAAARRHGMHYFALPVKSGVITDDDVAEFAALLESAEGPVLAFCRTGTRSVSLWALHEARHLSADAIYQSAKGAGYDLESLKDRLEQRGQSEAGAASHVSRPVHDVVIIGGGAGGLATAASLLQRRGELDIAVIEPRDQHYYQPGWTLVGAGVFDRAQTERQMASVMPDQVKWIRSAVAGFEPEQNSVVLEDGERIEYRTLVVAPGIKLNWNGVEGLMDTLGKNGVTSNYMFDLAPYTWELVQNLRSGNALFTQPPMPIKCAGAPQKALYLSCDHWRRGGRLKNIEVDFYNAGGVLFGVEDYVPALQSYVDRYRARVNYHSNLVAVDGPARTAWFNVTDGDAHREVKASFDMLHVCPPQTAPDFVAQSPLADAAGWLEVSPETLEHPAYGNVFGVGDVCSAPNAKTAAAVRKQAPVVAENVLSALDGESPRAVYDGYGSCPLTVERGKIVLAEFGYGGKLLPSFPTWLFDGRKPTRLAWFMKERLLPPIYFELMLKGREWLAAPTRLPHNPTPHDAEPAIR
ncbi:MAG: bifunctional protein tyrosine phosphatase family protein/NAD(P)/FAD-dependent oxidoreductase [Gammaproteobacteria bacterium]|nr:bifunctional protein tyrosine phosphatase family protein/NAD(P)/FAD-dependent oxidoreductase [Gammaproteobacteria bacterium]